MRTAHALSKLKPGLLRFLRTTFILVALAVPIVFGTIGYNTTPLWYWGIALIVVPGRLYFIFRRAVSLADARVRAKKRWKSQGSAVERITYTQFERLQERYGEATRDPRCGYVDDRTWADLGMDEIHAQLDICFTMAGRNELYRILRHALPGTNVVRERAALIDLFHDNKERRLEIAEALARIGEERDADPAVLLWGDAVRSDRLFPLFVGMCGAAIAAILITAFLNATLGAVAIVVIFITNMVVYYRKARHLSVDVPALRVLSRMVDTARRLPFYDLPAQSQEAARCKRAFRWLLTGAPSPTPSFSGDIVEMLLVYVKIYFQIDLIAYNRIIRTITAKRDSFQRLYHGIGSIDALYALASYRAMRKRTCDAGAPAADATTSPDVATAAIELQGVYHPLIKKAIANTVSIGRPGAIVTGTNMAGKSTFLRTVGISVLFAQAAGFAFAKRYAAPLFRIMSSIEKHDDLAEGKSFYYDEAERIYRMIEEVGEGAPVLLLIDELLSGTNSLERESASIAILHYLAESPALTVAATHDVAIARGVADRYELYYFTDSADETGLSFDYTIHEGVVQTRNAIKLLRLIGYPEDVIAGALERTGAPEG
jgi:hypothetical protein